MKVWIVMSKVQEIEARCVDKVFDSKEKADSYVREQEKRENLPNLSGFDHTVEEWEIE
jgi:Mg2+ and Co2+ transporter CorA